VKQTLLLFTVLTALVASASAQSRYVFDNFDTSAGVQVALPPPPPAKPTAKNAKKNGGQKQSINPRVQQTAMMRNFEPSMRMSAGTTLGNFSTGDPKVDGFILTSAARYNVDPLLVYATMSQESAFKPRAISYKGARGLMQLMPATAARFGVTNIFDPQQNIDAGVKYLRWLLNTFNQDVRLALAGYNAGEGAVMKYGYNIPPYRETQDYVARITARYSAMRDPNYVRSIMRGSNMTAANTAKPTKAAAPAPPPPPMYEAASLVVRLPDGKIQLLTQ
jgi:soluble lytic murein transglycosylase-like protein